MYYFLHTSCMETTFSHAKVGQRAMIITFCVALCFAFAQQVGAAGYIKFDGIDGESKGKDHDKWIDISSVSQEITRYITDSTGTVRNRGRAQFGDIVITKRIDSSTPKLMEAIAKGSNISSVLIDLVAGKTEGSSPYFQWELKNVQITSSSMSGGVEGNDRPTETISLNFGGIKTTYPKAKGNVEFEWKVEEGES